jgi:hypothetical protein
MMLCESNAGNSHSPSNIELKRDPQKEILKILHSVLGCFERRY